MTVFATSEHFLRPDNTQLTRRNRRQMQAQRLLAFAGRLLFAFLAILLTYWMFQRTQRDSRFAVRSVELGGVKHTTRSELQRVSRQWIGMNLFQLDIDRVQNDLQALPWVERVSIEKKLPSTLKITVTERRPVALAMLDGSMRYVDKRGNAFAELTPEVGNPDLPLILSSAPAQRSQCLQVLQALQSRHPAIYSRISEIGVAGENGFLVFDRDLRTRIFIDGENAADKWITLYGIASAEGFREDPPDHVDLRFDDRIIVKVSSHESGVTGTTGSDVDPRPPTRDPRSDREKT